eukprot:83242_1
MSTNYLIDEEEMKRIAHGLVEPSSGWIPEYQVIGPHDLNHSPPKFTINHSENAVSVRCAYSIPNLPLSFDPTYFESFHDIQQISLVFKPNFVNTDDSNPTISVTVPPRQWYIIGTDLNTQEDEIVFNIRMKRKMKPLIIGIIIPIMCLSVIGCLSEWMEDRQSELTAILLAIIAVNYVYSSYNVRGTYIDACIAGGFLLIYIFFLFVLSVMDADVFPMKCIILALMIVVFILYAIFKQPTQSH